MITESDLGSGQTQYELREGSLHHHLVCSSCHGTYALDNSVLEPLRRTLLGQHGFEADLDHLVIFGRCSRCLAPHSGDGAGAPPASSQRNPGG